MSEAVLWLAFGFAGQLLFATRFVIQWAYSERRGRSMVPVAFWYFSILGAAVLSVYAVHLGDPVFVSGQLLGLIIYVRNLQLIRRERLSRLPSPDI
jgi:lipid-A-disaccharide synthase-like uncharacterized protein